MEQGLIESIAKALITAFAMFWEVLWPLALGFLLSAIIQTVVSKRAVASVLGQDSPQGVALACGFGAASSSCSYAAVSVAGALLRKCLCDANDIDFDLDSINQAL